MEQKAKAWPLDYIVQRKYVTNGDIDTLVIPQWLNEYYAVMDEFDSICECDPEFGAVIQQIFSSMCKSVVNKCFEFGNDLESMHLFMLEEDTSNLMDMIWLESVVGTCIKFLEDIFKICFLYGFTIHILLWQFSTRKFCIQSLEPTLLQ